MNKFTQFTVPALRILLAAEKDGGSGGGSKSLETQLSDAKADLTKLTSQVDALTKERDAAKAEASNLQAQFDAATTAATESKAEVKRLTDELTGVKADRDDKATKLTTAEGNVTRLKALCKIKGIAEDAQVPAAGNEGGAKGHVLDQWAEATGSKKRALYTAHKTEIRAEARRRGAVVD